MSKKGILWQVDLLSRIAGRRIIQVRRQLFIDDFSAWPDDIRDQESDGPVEFTCDNGTILHFSVNSAEQGIDVAYGAMAPYGPSYMIRDVSHNPFWTARSGTSVKAMFALQSIYQAPEQLQAFGIELRLENSATVVLEYISDEDHVDALRVSDRLEGLARRVCIFTGDNGQERLRDSH